MEFTISFLGGSFQTSAATIRDLEQNLKAVGCKQKGGVMIMPKGQIVTEISVMRGGHGERLNISGLDINRQGVDR